MANNVVKELRYNKTIMYTLRLLAILHCFHCMTFPLILISLNVVERSLLLEMILVTVVANGDMLNLMS